MGIQSDIVTEVHIVLDYNMRPNVDPRAERDPYAEHRVFSDPTVLAGYRAVTKSSGRGHVCVSLQRGMQYAGGECHRSRRIAHDDPCGGARTVFQLRRHQDDPRLCRCQCCRPALAGRHRQGVRFRRLERTAAPERHVPRARQAATDQVGDRLCCQRNRRGMTQGFFAAGGVEGAAPLLDLRRSTTRCVRSQALSAVRMLDP